MAAASTVSAARSSGSRWWTSDLPQARARAVTSMVVARRKLATASAARTGIEPALEHGVLGGDADRAAAGVAVRAVPGRGARAPRSRQSTSTGRAGGVAVDAPVAAEGEQRGHPDGHGVGSEGERLGHVGTRADPARDDRAAPRRPRRSRPGPRPPCAPPAGWGCPACSMKTSWVAAVPPCIPSTTTTSAPAATASFTSWSTRVAPTFT